MFNNGATTRYLPPSIAVACFRDGPREPDCAQFISRLIICSCGQKYGAGRVKATMSHLLPRVDHLAAGITRHVSQNFRSLVTACR